MYTCIEPMHKGAEITCSVFPPRSILSPPPTLIKSGWSLTGTILSAHDNVENSQVRVLCPTNGASPRLSWFEHILSNSTVRAYPTVRNILKSSPRFNPVFRIAYRRIINITANRTLPFHRPNLLRFQNSITKNPDIRIE